LAAALKSRIRVVLITRRAQELRGHANDLRR
jgi:hypothetical protein